MRFEHTGRKAPGLSDSRRVGAARGFPPKLVTAIVAGTLQRIRFVLSVATLACLAAVVAAAHSGPEKTFTGEISDSQCSFNVHSRSQSHKEMMDMSSDLKTPADCARFCVRERGGRYVLHAKNKVYKLDNQNLAGLNAGLEVKLVGVLDPKTDTIAIHSIEPLPKADSH